MITLDFETFYDKDFSLSKLTTEEYVRDPRFEVIGVAVKVNDEEAVWCTGSHDQIKSFLNTFDWGNHFALAHNAMFDAAIMTWRFGIRPKAWLDTLSMARAVLGPTVSVSLAKLTEHFGLGAKGTEVNEAKGLRRADFAPEQLRQYGMYCCNDVDLTYALYKELDTSFPVKEKKLIDLTIRMFSDPVLVLDLQRLQSHLADVQERKRKLFENANITPEVLNSNKKFAALLESFGVAVPMKISPTTGKLTYAFAKSDEDFLNLQTWDDERVQAVVAARLGAKSTLEETRTERFITIASHTDNHVLPIPLKYYAAHTGRWGGSDSVNLQNLPSRGAQGGKLKRCITAPEGHVIIDCDSSQIEARVLAWLAGQYDLLERFAQKADVYKYMASLIYGKSIGEVTADERFIGKTTVLGAGYGMGATKFQAQLLTMGKSLDIDTCKFIIKMYRQANPNIANWWNGLALLLEYMASNRAIDRLDVPGVLELSALTGIKLPNNMYINYPELRRDTDGQYSYTTRYGRNRIYGGKIAENICQAVARCIIGEQMIEISKRYRVALTVHDAIACVVPESESEEARAFIEQCMRTSPSWAVGLPLNCESGMARTYGDC
jgi:DNA polymerase I-like protein with 3'-5' exonuclease and polymerase domains